MSKREIWRIGKAFVDMNEVIAINEMKPFGIIEIHFRNGDIIKVDDVTFDSINRLFVIYCNCNDVNVGVINE